MRKVLYFLLLFFLSTQVGISQNIKVNTYQSAIEAYEAGTYDEAMEEALLSLQVARKEQGLQSSAYRQSLRLLSLVSYSSGFYERGRDYALQEVNLLLRSSAPDKSKLAQAFYNLSLFQVKLENLEDALSSAHRGVQLYEEEKLSKDKTYFELQLLISKCYIQQERLASADTILSQFVESSAILQSWPELQGLAYYLSYNTYSKQEQPRQVYLLEEAYTLLNQQYNKESDGVTENLYLVTEALAYHYQQNLELEKAYNLYLQINTLFESSQLNDSLQWAGVMNNLGVLTVKTDPAKANQWLEKSFKITEKLTSIRDEAFWSSLDNYAMSLHNLLRSEEALSLYQRYATLIPENALVPPAFATAMNNLAMILRNQGKSKEALASLKRARKVSLSERDPAKADRLKLSTLYYNLAQAHQSLSQYDTAIYYYKRSTDESKLANATLSAEYLAAINGMAGLYHDIGYYTEADIFYSEALRIQNVLAGEETNTYASILSNYALLYQDKGAYKDALVHFKKALDIKRKLLGLDHPDYVAVLANIGLLYLEQANYEQARRMLETAFVKLEGLYGYKHPRLANALTNLARLEIALGNYPEAEPLLKRALNIQKVSYGEQHPAYATIAVEMGNFYMLLGNYDAARPLLERSRQLLAERYGKAHPSYATATQNMAVLAQAQGDMAQAESFLLETLAIDRQTLGKQNPKYALTLNNLASFYQNLDSLKKATPFLKEALSICQNALAPRHPLYTATLLNLGLLYQELQQYADAEPVINETVRLRKEFLGDRHPDYAYALYAQAVNDYRQDNFQRARQNFEQVIQLYTQQIKEYFPVLSEKEKSAFYQRIVPVLNAYRDFVININLQEDVPDDDKGMLVASLYDLQLLTKAMLLNASNLIRRSIFESEDPGMINLYQQWNDLKEQLAKLYAMPTDEIRNRNINLKEIENQANELEKRLSEQSQLFARELAGREISWKDLQDTLKSDEAVVEIVRVSNEASKQVIYTALILDKLRKFPVMLILPEGEAMETKNYNYYQNAITYRIEDEFSYALYWQPISDALSEGTNKVFVAPDGVYNKISLNSLYNKDSNQFLLDEVDLRMLSSTRELLENPTTALRVGYQPIAYLLGFPDYRHSGSYPKNTQETTPGTEVTSISFKDSAFYRTQAYEYIPLPGTKKEVNSIHNLLRRADWRTRKLIGQEASEANIKQVAVPDVLHFATHGFFLSDLSVKEEQQAFGIHMQNAKANPLLRSGLLLSGAARSKKNYNHIDLESEDGVLTAYEAMNLNLMGTELVVLSACQTALGEIKNGEGVYGLQRAFLVAGAQSVMMSLWKVNDASTTELIRFFYQYWLSGQDKHTALANAQRKIRDTYQEPYHWAPFVLIGN